MNMREIMDTVTRAALNERYETHPPQVVFHGSKKSVVQNFEYRNGVRGAFFDVKEVKANGFFFAQTAEDAKSFGPFVGAYHINLKRPLVTGADGIDGIRDPKREADVRYVLSALMKPEEPGWNVYNGMNNDIYASDEQMTSSPGHEARDDDWIYHFMGAGGLDWEVLDHPEAIKRMVERGYDGTAVNEPGTHDNRAWFVLRPDQVRFVEQVYPDPYDHDEDDWH